MKTFQFDKCFDDKKIIRKCNEENLVNALRLPPPMRTWEDPELLDTFMKLSNPLITLDRSMPADHATSIPDSNPGIVVVGNAPGIPQTITTLMAGKTLAQFKARFKDMTRGWHELPIKNSIVEITQKSVQVWHVVGGKLISDKYLSFDETGWMERLVDLLVQNEQRDPGQANKS
jgi:hypothetical protein